jgi:hypothetical protein|tara:strand:- start:3241 stop:3540 length:300 start_codon:yes stop_codon:yes gene_type:complete
MPAIIAEPTPTEDTIVESDPNDNWVITNFIFDNMGKPSNLKQINIKSVFDCNGVRHYRVNIFLKADRESVMQYSVLTHSFFVSITDEKIKTNPKVERLY